MAIDRLRKTEEFREVFTKGNKKIGRYMILYILKTAHRKNRIGIIIKKKVGNAVKRNQLKRQLKEIFRKQDQSKLIITGYSIIVLAKEKIIQAHFSDLETEFKELIQS